MSTTTTNPEKPPRKFPPPCWTQDETLALIDAYRDRWYALRRGYLRTADWDAVADAVGRRCPDASPSKTSAQCRHKMEKLRQRYRTEKQRSLSFPGRFFSSWFFFDNMDAMDNGSSSAVGSNQVDTANRLDSSSGGGLRIKTLGDRNLIESVVGTKHCKKIDGNSNPNQDGIDLGGGIRVKALGFGAKNCSKIDGNSNPNFGSRVLNGYPHYLDDGSDEDVGDDDDDDDDDTDFGGGFRVRTPIDGKFVPPMVTAKKLGKIHRGPNFDQGDGVDNGRSGFCATTNPIDQDFVPPGFRPKKFGKLNPNFDAADGGFCVKIFSTDRYSVPTGLRTKSYGKNDRSRVLNGFSSSLGGGGGGGGGGEGGLGKKSDVRGGVKKRERGEIAEMVSSIKLLGEGFVKMEKMKMEMAREIEKMRIEMEMKRNELILESQQQIVDAFVTVLAENKKTKTNTTASPSPSLPPPES